MMALYITYTNRDREYHVQDFTDNVKRNNIRGTAIGVESVQADGHELEYIQNRFTNLPTVNNRVVRWYGDYAKFIVGNL